MSWDQIWLHLQAAVPTVETGLAVAAALVTYFLVQRWAGVRQTAAVVARDLGIVAVTWLVTTALVNLDANNHWMQRTAGWISNLL